jgi:ABC-type uncharacterized transport system substrate-binding protein
VCRNIWKADRSGRSTPRLERCGLQKTIKVAGLSETENASRVIDYATEHRLPAIYEQDFVTRDGGLMSYGADQRETFDRAAALADRIFKGAKPADLPVEAPTRRPNPNLAICR